jgi:hypothetical protein
MGLLFTLTASGRLRHRTCGGTLRLSRRLLVSRQFLILLMVCNTTSFFMDILYLLGAFGIERPNLLAQGRPNCSQIVLR